MGRNLEQHEPVISLEHRNPGCIKGIFHQLNHRKWYNVRKRLPHKRNFTGKHSSGIEDPVTGSNAGGVRENLETEAPKSSIHAKSSESRPGHKSSMKSRIKALISEEVHKRRGRHHRSSSCPTQMPEQTPSNHHLDVSSVDPFTETGLRNESLDHQDNTYSLVFSLLDPLLPRSYGESGTNDETCPLCAAMVTKNHLRQSDISEDGKQPMKDRTLVQDELVYAIEPSRITSLQESKIFFDALDLLNLRKELFLKVLQDPNSSLSHHLHNHRASSSRLGLTKSASFPVPGSSGKRIPLSDSPRSKGGGGSCTGEEIKPQESIADVNPNVYTSTGTYVDDEAPNHPLLMPDSLDMDNGCIGSPKEFKKQHMNKFIIKRFKNLGEKIKHAIKEGRKERQRIFMDGVLHKIPYGYPKDVKVEADMNHDMVAQNWGKYSPGESSRNDQSSAFGKSRPDGIRRITSFNESLSKYCRLIELPFHREENSHICDRSKTRTGGGRPASLGRILSSPNLRSHSFSKIERLPTTKSSLVDQKVVASENLIPVGSSSRNDSHENFQQFAEPLNELGGSKRRESTTNQNDRIEPTSDFVHYSKMEKDSTGESPAVEDLELPAEGLDPYKEDALPNPQHKLIANSPVSHENNIETDETKTPPRQFYNDLLHVQVDMKNKADFNYVRDVLELSGFSGTKFFGKWHSDEQPVDPLVFEEVKGCLLAQPDCYANEEGGIHNHMLLFDLINEVLLEIYGRTFSYWPKPLTCCSQVHPMPVGYHVLEDVWTSINWYLRRRPEIDPSFDDAVSHDLSKSDGWMNVQFEAECVGIELEDMIFDDLVEELVFS